MAIQAGVSMASSFVLESGGAIREDWQLFKMVSTAQLAKIAILLFLQLPTCEASASDHEFCSSVHFYSKEERKCVPCQQKCSHGQGLTQNCGLYKREPACKDCPANHYSKLEYVTKNHEGHYVCKPCKQCGDRRRKDGRQFNRTCTRFEDAVCMDCPLGYYDGAQHGEEGCFKCGPCCSQSPDWRSQCKQMGLGGMCSCPQRTWGQCPQNKVQVCEAKINALTGGMQATTAFHSLTTQLTTITTTTTTMPMTASTTSTKMPPSTAMERKRDPDLSTFTKRSGTTSSPTTIYVSRKINTTLRQDKDKTLSKTKAPNSTVWKKNTKHSHSTFPNPTKVQPNARRVFSLVTSKAASQQGAINSKYQMKERFYLVATSIVAAFVFILIFVILIIKCKSKHNKHQSCDHPSEVSMLSTESRSVEVTGEQETGYVEGIMKETPRKEVNKAVPFESSDEHIDYQDEPWKPMIVAKSDFKTQFQPMIKEGKQSSSSGKRFNRSISKEEDIQRHGTAANKRPLHLMIKEDKQFGVTGERILRGISKAEDMQQHGMIASKKHPQVHMKDAKQSVFNGERILPGISKEEDDQRHKMTATNKYSQNMTKEAKLSGFTGEGIFRGISREEDMQNHEVICRKCKHDCVVQICGLTKDTTCDKKVEELRGCQRTYLIKKLDVEIPGINSWKELAQIVGVDNTTIDNWKGHFQAGGFSPTESLIHHMIAGNTLVSQLLNHLDTIRRFDIRDALLEHLENKCDLCRRTSCEESLV